MHTATERRSDGDNDDTDDCADDDDDHDHDDDLKTHDKRALQRRLATIWRRRHTRCNSAGARLTALVSLAHSVRMSPPLTAPLHLTATWRVSLLACARARECSRSSAFSSRR